MVIFTWIMVVLSFFIPFVSLIVSINYWEISENKSLKPLLAFNFDMFSFDDLGDTLTTIGAFLMMWFISFIFTFVIACLILITYGVFLLPIAFGVYVTYKLKKKSTK